MKARTRSRDWIADAIQKPGSFSGAARRHGKTTEAFAQKDKSASGKKGRRARLAAELMELHKNEAR